MRTYSAIGSLLFLAACGEADAPLPGDPTVIANVEEQARIAAADDGLVLCAVSESDGFARVCTAERTYDADGQLMTIRSPDGGFRRLRADREGWRAADGAEPAVTRAVAPDLFEIAIGGARYRLPAP